MELDIGQSQQCTTSWPEKEIMTGIKCMKSNGNLKGQGSFYSTFHVKIEAI